MDDLKTWRVTLTKEIVYTVTAKTEDEAAAKVRAMDAIGLVDMTIERLDRG